MTEQGQGPEGSQARELEELTRDYEQWRSREASEHTMATEESEHALEKLLEISSFLHRIHERGELLSYVSDRLREFFDAQNSFVILFGAGGAPQILESNLVSEGGTEPLLSSTVLERVRSTRAPIVISDTSQDPALSRRTSIEYLRISSVMCAPLIVEDEVIGVLQFDHRGEAHAFPDSDVRLLQLFADQIATAVHNLQLIEGRRRALEETREAQEKLIQSERLAAVGRLAAGVAHDFNNTLFIVLGQCDILLAAGGLTSTSRTAIERIQSCAIDAARTVRRLQNLGPGSARVANAPVFAIGEVLGEVPELTREKWHKQARARGVHLKLAINADPNALVCVEPADLREVLTNLIFNAVEAMEGDGEIRIDGRVQGEHVLVEVRDEGRGMSVEECERAFEPFFSSKSGRGHGLGLATSWSLVEAMGGTLTLRSQPGEGTKVLIQLERALRPATLEKTSETRPAESCSIAIVDDDLSVRLTLEGMLRSAGHHVVGYSSGAECLTELRGGGVDLVLTDLRMPGMDGVELAEKLQQSEPNLPVILLTGAESQTRGERPANVRASLSKPVGLGNLESVIARVLQEL